jgi:Probable cobalt transporter subunit (CbtA)
VVGRLLLRGMLVGVVAGLLAFGFARIFGEPQVERAIAFEEQMIHSHGEMEEPALVSREMQAGLGLFVGVIVYGTAIGGFFSLAFGFIYGRFGRLGPRATSALLALAAYVAIVLVPSIKYPANPPSVGNPDTIGLRTGLFFMMLMASVAAVVLAALVARRLSTRYGPWNATLIAGAGFIVVIGIVQLALPEVNEVPEHFPAVVLWHFRIASLGMQAVLWTTIGLLFGALTERSCAGRFNERASARLYQSIKSER